MVDIDNNFNEFNNEFENIDIDFENIDFSQDTIDDEEYYFEDAYYQYIKMINRYKLLSPEEEKELFIQYFNGNKQLFETLVNANLRLVATVARRFILTKMPIMDLIQDGNIGLIAAVNNYNPNKNTRFSTYAVPCIINSIRRGLDNNSRTIRIPVPTLEIYRELQQQISKEEIKLGRPLDDNELRLLLKKKYRVYAKTNLCNSLISLDRPIDTDSFDTLGSLIEDKTNCTIEDQAIVSLYKEIVLDALNTLSDKEKELIIRRYFSEDGVVSFEELAKEYNCKRQNVDQAEKRIFKKLRRKSSVHKLCDD